MPGNNQSGGRWTHSACAMCLTAPMKVRIDKGRITEIKGKDIPGWDGMLCGKAIAGIGGRIYAPDRILFPLKRVGKRGEGKFVRCSWEEVIEAHKAKENGCRFVVIDPKLTDTAPIRGEKISPRLRV